MRADATSGSIRYRGSGVLWVSSSVTAVPRLRLAALLATLLSCSNDDFTASEPNPVPELTEVLPEVIFIGTASATVSLYGTGFTEKSRVQVDGSSRLTTYVSATALRFVLSADQLASESTFDVRVVNPPPGGGTSESRPLAIAYRVPQIAAATPDSILRGSAAAVVVLTGSNFIAGTTLTMDGVPRAITVVNGTTIRVPTTAADAVAERVAELRLTNPDPGGTSAPFPLRIVVPAPSINSVTPFSVAVGASGTTLTVTGSDFEPDAVISIDGTDRPTTVVNGSTATAELTTDDFATARSIEVRVRTSRGSSLSSITVLPPEPGVGTPIVVELLNNHIVADPVRPVVYASIPGSVAMMGNTVTKIDAETGAILGAVFVGSEPGRMAIAENGEYLYVALGGAAFIARVRLADFQKDLDLPLPDAGFFGATRAEDLEVIPGSSTLLAVSLRNLCCSPRHEGVVLYSGATLLPSRTQRHTGSNRIAVGTRPDILYGHNNETSEFGVRRIAVTASGVQELQSVGGTLGWGYGMDIEHSGNRIWATSGGVVNDVTLAAVGTIPVWGAIRPDALRGRAHVLSAGVLRTYHYAGFTLIGSAPLSDATGLNTLVRTGTDGLAMGGGERIVIVYGSLIGP